MMNDFQIDGRKWRFLEYPGQYIKKNEKSGLKLEPLKRQFKTTKAILSRLNDGCGVLLADDVGLGKTTIGALVAWVVACQGKRVRIYVPNDVMRRRWAAELERHVPMLQPLGAGEKLIKKEKIAKLWPGRIQIATHHALVNSKKLGQKTECDLMIIDEAHRAKGDKSNFKKALVKLGNSAKRKLILTATPFSINIFELKSLLQFVNPNQSSLDGITGYAVDLKRLYELGDGHDVAVESRRLVGAAKTAINELKPSLIRHGIEDLKEEEKKHFGSDAQCWEIPPAQATKEDIELLLRIDRLLDLTSERKGERRNDPRLHIGWQHADIVLERAKKRIKDDTDHVAHRHLTTAIKALEHRRKLPHPKVAAVSDAIRQVLDSDE